MKKLFVIISILILTACTKDSGPTTGNTTGKNGSITRFAIKDDFMYAIDLNFIRVFDISINDNPQLVKSIEVAYGLETIFIYDTYIYLGAVDGVYVLDIKNPTQPVQLEKIEHHISCDPVVVQNNYAYSTQRINNTGCGSAWQQSALAVYDVSQPNQSNLVNSITMGEPYGLAADGDWLFVCDPDNGGIVVFDISNPASPIEKTSTYVDEPRDIITMYPYMIVSTKTKFELFNYSDPLHMTYISSIALQ